jgi:uncharacterized membrane protein
MHIFGYDMPRLHAALNDLPAALLVVAVLFELGSWALKRESLKWAALWTLWAGVIGGWAAVIAGELAEDVIEHGEAIHDLMETHETLALTTMGVFTVVLGWKLWRRFRVSPTEEWVLRILSLAGLVLVIATGVYGGKLMFEHAAGIPMKTMRAEMEDREAGHHHEGGEAEERAHPAAGADTVHHDAPGNPPHSH